MATSDAYAAVPRAQLTYDYLHTNSTTHEFLFGALAELVDNSRDAASKRIDIYSVPAESYRGKYMLCFLDDGDGMDPDEVANVIKFGRSDKRIIDKNMIGQYGNGLKSGTMRIAKDMILFTKKENKVSCLMISRTFHEREKITEILIPMPSWDARTKKPLLRKHIDMKQHIQEVKIITDYSPFKSVDRLFAEFDKIKSTGTLVILYNLQLMDDGKPELDVTTDPHDILMADPNGEIFDAYTMPERKSFRAYTAILYLDPKMKIYIQNKKVRTVRLTTSLYKPATYAFTSKRFKCRLEREEKKAEHELKLAEANAHELEIQEREEREKSEGTLKESLVGQRQAGVRLAEALTDVNFKKMILNNTRKALKDPQTLDFIFGINLNKRRCCGVMVYNCNRLIKMYEKVGCQTEGGIQGFGVMGVVNVPYLVLEPTHNKQDFADGKEYKSLTKALGEHLDDYWKNCPIAKQGGLRFWDSYGYNSSKWRDDPSNDDKYVRKRMMDLTLYVQCDKCLKWRDLAFHSRYVQHEPDEHWCCKMNPDADCNNCQRPEKKPASITRATLNKSKPAQKTTTETSRPSPATENRSQAVRQSTQPTRQSTQPTRQPTPPTRRQPSPPRRRQPSPPRRQPTPPKTYKSIRPAPSQPKTVVATSNNSSRQKSQTNGPRQGERLAPTSTQTQPRQIKEEKTSQSKSQVGRKPGRPKADSTEDKQDSIMKRPHPDNKNVDESQKESVKRRKSDVASSLASASTTQATVEPEVNNDNTDMDWTNEREVVSSGSPKPTPSKSSDYDITTLQERACRAKTDDGEWHAGTIVCLKQGRDGIRAKVKFREHRNDKYDKWYDYPGSGIRLEEPRDSVVSPSSPVNQASPQPLPTSSSIELPSTTTREPPTPIDNASSPISPVASPDNTVSSLADREETIQDLAGLLRKLLEFFRPPTFFLTKEQLSSLSVQELRTFNSKEFCDQYEMELGTLMNDITAKGRIAEQRVEELETRCDELSSQLATKTEEVEEKTERLEEVTGQLTSLQRKTCRLIGMVNDRENHISEEEVETTLDNFIDMLQNDLANN